VRQKYAAEFPEIKLFPVTAVAKSWTTPTTGSSTRGSVRQLLQAEK